LHACAAAAHLNAPGAAGTRGKSFQMEIVMRTDIGHHGCLGFVALNINVR